MEGSAHTVFATSLTSPLRKTAPYGPPVHRLGDCAGRSPGSRVVVSFGLPGCPVAISNETRRSQLRGQPRMALHVVKHARRPCSLLPPRSDPGNQHGKNYRRLPLTSQTDLRRAVAPVKFARVIQTRKGRRGFFNPAPAFGVTALHTRRSPKSRQTRFRLWIRRSIRRERCAPS